MNSYLRRREVYKQVRITLQLDAIMYKNGWFLSQTEKDKLKSLLMILQKDSFTTSVTHVFLSKKLGR